MTQHRHPTPVPGCYRCELREDEARDHQAAEWDDLKHLADAATPGPWRAALLDGVVHEDGSSGYRGGIYPGTEPGPPPVLLTNSVDRHDAEFIAAAREAVPALITEVRQLRGDVWALQEQDERAEIWREKANRYHVRLAAVEALADRWSHCGDPGDPRRKAATALCAALETDTTKEN